MGKEDGADASQVSKRLREIVRGGNCPPFVGPDVRLAAVRIRDLGPSLAEMPRRDDQNRVTRRTEVCDSRLHGPRARGCEDEQVVRRAKDLVQPLEAAREESPEVRA